MKKFVLLSFLLFSIHLFAQYSTPGNNGSYTLDDLVSLSGGVVSTIPIGYAINADLTISETDTLKILEGGKLSIENGALWTIQGTLIIDASPYFEIFSLDDSYFGIRFENSHESIMSKVLMADCGGIKLIESNMEFHHCNFEEFSKDYSSGAIDLFHSNPLIRECTISYCEGPAVSSGANAASSPKIINNEFISNVTSNSNTPQINLGTSDGISPIVVDSNIIQGEFDNAGGIALSTLAGGNVVAFVRFNEITNNRYGLAMIGNNINGTIHKNYIAGNNIQNNPSLGGSGLNFYGDETNVSIVSYNTIIDNLWGVTIQGTAKPNLGDGTEESPGTNLIYENGNSGDLYALYNNTAEDIQARNNYWNTGSLMDTEEVIYHNVDDNSLGEVFFDPILIHVGVEENQEMILSFYPNPVKDFLIWNNPNTEMEIYSTDGKLMWFGNLKHGEKLEIQNWKAGIYFIQQKNQTFKFVKK